MSRIWSNPRARDWRAASAPADCRAFHAQLTGYAPTPLRSVPALAQRLGVGAIYVKDESSRLGLPAFKILGASWGVHQALARREGERDLRLLAATDGNHGRAVARMAKLRGLPAEILIPSTVGPHVRAAIESEGATVTVIDGSYDDAVLRTREIADADPTTVLVQDTAWPGYEQVPAWIVEGYETLFAEIDEQLAPERPDLVVVPTGVGSLLAAAVAHYRAPGVAGETALLAVEPAQAACVLASLRAGAPTVIDAQPSVMEGLTCGTMSAGAWPVVSAGLDAAVAIDDDAALAAAAELLAHGVPAGPCGAAALAGLDAASAGLDLNSTTTIVLLNTEGVRSTD